MPYGASFAAVYDALMAEDFDYTAWAAYYTDLLASAGVHPGYLVECGCGTASLGIEWARRGIRVLGVDQSPDMLAIAAQRARQAGVPLALARQDIAQLCLGRRADAIVATCDTVNYLASPRAARAFFQRAHAGLKAGGALALDVSSRYKLEEEMGDAPFLPCATIWPTYGKTTGIALRTHWIWSSPFSCAKRTAATAALMSATASARTAYRNSPPGWKKRGLFRCARLAG